MRSLFALVSCAAIIAASGAFAETRVFIIANQADGYGIDQCLAKGDRCGAQVARTYCQSRDFAQASSYRRVDPDEITGSVPINRRKLLPWPLRRICRNHLPALNSLGTGGP
ncbi:hypothetical protein ACVINX_006644 [Bradyrhizobium diazoefficiens]